MRPLCVRAWHFAIGVDKLRGSIPLCVEQAAAAADKV
jgi:hypothetical protein